jgi:hypothetical protein
MGFIVIVIVILIVIYLHPFGYIVTSDLSEHYTSSVGINKLAWRLRNTSQPAFSLVFHFLVQDHVLQYKKKGLLTISLRLSLCSAWLSHSKYFNMHEQTTHEYYRNSSQKRGLMALIRRKCFARCKTMLLLAPTSGILGGYLKLWDWSKHAADTIYELQNKTF